MAKVFAFEDLHFSIDGYRPWGVTSQPLHFENGYGVSVYKYPGSRGYWQDLYELTKLKHNVPQWTLGYLTPKDVGAFMTEISLLDPNTGLLPKGVCPYVQEKTEEKERWAYLDSLGDACP